MLMSQRAIRISRSFTLHGSHCSRTERLNDRNVVRSRVSDGEFRLRSRGMRVGIGEERKSMPIVGTRAAALRCAGSFEGKWHKRRQPRTDSPPHELSRKCQERKAMK